MPGPTRFPVNFHHNWSNELVTIQRVSTYETKARNQIRTDSLPRIEPGLFGDTRPVTDMSSCTVRAYPHGWQESYTPPDLGCFMGALILLTLHRLI